MILPSKLAGISLRPMLFCALFLLSPSIIRCQEERFPVDVAAGYSYLRAHPAGNAGAFGADGGTAAAAWNFTSSIALAADFSGYNFRSQPAGVGGHLLTYTAGPRYTRSHETFRCRPFAQALVGGARVSGNLNGLPAGENGFALILGGGLNTRVTSLISIRVLEADYLLTRFNRVTNTTGLQHDLRISTGVVLRFGH